MCGAWLLGRSVVIQWCHAFLPRLARGSGPVGAVDFRVDGVVGVADGEDPVVGVGEDGGQRLGGALPRPVEHLRLELGELVLEVGEVVGQRLDDGRVQRAVHAVVRGAQVLGTLEGADEVAPEPGLLGEGGVVGVEVEVHLAHAGVAAAHLEAGVVAGLWRRTTDSG